MAPKCYINPVDACVYRWGCCTYMSVYELDLDPFKVRGPFVETLCIEKDSYIDAI